MILTKQNGRVKAFDVVLLLCAVIIFMVFAYWNSTASASKVQDVLTLANQSSDAAVKVKAFLLEHPTPNNSELDDLKSDVNRLVVRDLARKATGNPALKTESEMAKDSEKAIADHQTQEQARLELQLENTSFMSMSMDDRAQFLAHFVATHLGWCLLVFFVPVVGMELLKKYLKGDSH